MGMDIKTIKNILQDYISTSREDLLACFCGETEEEKLEMLEHYMDGCEEPTDNLDPSIAGECQLIKLMMQTVAQIDVVEV
jgi:hypothetical protein